MDVEIGERRDRLQRTELKIRGLIDFIATGDKSDYVVSTMRDLEAYARTEKAEIAELIEESRVPISLPTCIDRVDLIAAVAQDFAQRDLHEHRRATAGARCCAGYLKDGR